MKKTVLMALAALGCAQAQAEVRQETQATGYVQIAAGMVGNCSQPPVLPMANLFNSYTITSSFSYMACKQYVTYDVDVQGEGWNSKKTRLPGTERYSYRIEQINKDASQTLFGYTETDRNGNVYNYPPDLASWLLTVGNVRSNCESMRSVVVQSQLPLEQTNCAGQSVQYSR